MWWSRAPHTVSRPVLHVLRSMGALTTAMRGPMHSIMFVIGPTLASDNSPGVSRDGRTRSELPLCESEGAGHLSLTGSFAPNGQVSVSWHIVDRDDEVYAEKYSWDF